MASLTKLQDDWRFMLARSTTDRAGLVQQRAPLAEKVAAFNADKPHGLWGKLSHAFRKATKIASVNRKVHKLDKQINDCDSSLLRQANETFRQMGETALEKLTNGNNFRENYAVLQETRRVLRDTDATLTQAIDQCGSASTTKLVDSFADNKVISVISWFQTRSATKNIGRAKEQLTALSKKLEQAPKIAEDLGDGVTFNNNFSLILDMVGGIGGAFGDWMAMDKLDNAANQMRGVSQKLGGIDGEIQKGMNNILGMSISVMRRTDPSMDSLAKDIAAHLPAEDASGMKPKAPTFNL